MSDSIEPKKLRWSVGTGGDLTQGDTAQATLTSEVRLTGSPDAGLQLVWTGSTQGTLAFKVAQVHDPQRPTLTKWSTLDPAQFDPAITHPAGGAGDFYCDFVDLGAEWLQVTLTRIGGSGPIEGWLKPKGA